MKTFDIPGGTASFREKDELTVGGSRAVALATRKLPRSALLPSAKEAGLVETDSETDLEVAVNAAVEHAAHLLGFPVGLSDEDIEAGWAYNDTLLVAYLGEWTLSRPLPRTREDLEDL